MSVFKRTFSSIFFKVDQVVGEIENHDALIRAAIKEQQQKLAVAKVECNRINKQAKQITEDIAELTVKASQWEARAMREADQDEGRALACVQQLDTVQAEIERLRTMQSQYKATTVKMSDEIKRGEANILELKQKHQMMRARQITADALGKFGTVGDTQMEDIETSFDRWEVKISQGEVDFTHSSFDSETEDLEQIYVAEERQEQLKARLAELKTKSGDNS